MPFKNTRFCIRFSFNCLFSRLQNCKGTIHLSIHRQLLPFWADLHVLPTLRLLLLCHIRQPSVDDRHSKTAQMVLDTCDIEELFQLLTCSVLPSPIPFLETEQSDCHQRPPILIDSSGEVSWALVFFSSVLYAGLLYGIHLFLCHEEKQRYNSFFSVKFICSYLLLLI